MRALVGIVLKGLSTTYFYSVHHNSVHALLYFLVETVSPLSLSDFRSTCTPVFRMEYEYFSSCAFTANIVPVDILVSSKISIFLRLRYICLLFNYKSRKLSNMVIVYALKF